MRLSLVAGALAASLAFAAPAFAQWYGPGYAYGPGPDQGYGPGYGYDEGYDVGPGPGPVVVAPTAPRIYEGRSAAVEVGPGSDAASFCAMHFRSYDPATGTYLGYDGQYHSCP